jgi:hypothetical protein
MSTVYLSPHGHVTVNGKTYPAHVWDAMERRRREANVRASIVRNWEEYAERLGAAEVFGPEREGDPVYAPSGDRKPDYSDNGRYLGDPINPFSALGFGRKHWTSNV